MFTIKIQKQTIKNIELLLEITRKENNLNIQIKDSNINNLENAYLILQEENNRIRKEKSNIEIYNIRLINDKEVCIKQLKFIGIHYDEFGLGIEFETYNGYKSIISGRLEEYKEKYNLPSIQ